MIFEKETLCSLFHRQALRWGDDCRFLSSKFDGDGRLTDRYHDMTWKEARTQVLDFGRGLVSLGVARGDRVALVAESRPWWIIADQAIQAAGAIGVPLYPTLTADELAFMIGNSGAVTIITSTVDKAAMALRVQPARSPFRAVIVMEPWSGNRPDNLHTFSEVMELGRRGISIQEIEDAVEQVEPEDIASVIYTSGTTGTPKGVILTHKNWMANMKQATHSTLIRRQKERELHLIHLVHLPLCHVYGRTSDYHVGGLSLGGILVFAESYESLGDNIREVRPNVIISIPRFFEKTYDHVKTAVERRSPRAQAIFAWAMKAGMEYTRAMAQGTKLSHPAMLRLGLANLLVFNRVRKTAGMDRLVLGVSGGGRLSEDICNFIRALGVQLNEGYGLTETCAVLNFNEPELLDRTEKDLNAWDNRMIDWLIDLLVEMQATGKSPFTSPLRVLKLALAYGRIGPMLRVKPGTVGRPVVNTEEIIAEDGEILAKGPQIFSGYWNLTRESKTAFTDDGWFKTGDIGQFDNEGFLSIIDRKKDIIVTSGGKNIAPRPIELALTEQPYIDQAILVGDGRNYCTALIVPDFEKLDAYGRSSGLDAPSREDMLNMDEIQALMRSQVDEVNRHLPRYEQVKYCSILTEPFRIETGELTPSMKMKRQVIEKKYRKEIDAMYR